MTGWDESHTLPVESGTFALGLDEWPEKEASSRYIDERILGRGGMGEVWQAWDTQLRRHVALKRVRDDGDAGLGARLVREARITAALEHPGIVAVHDAGIDSEGRPWYAMQLVGGKTLADHLADGPDASERRRLLRHVLAACEAVGFAHHAGVVHRDVKPANLQIGAFGETRVLDWGLARPIGEDAAWDEVLSRVGTLTEAGLVLGTPSCMSPEQAAGEVCGPAGDVWSLGVVLYEVVTGVPAYSGPSSQEVLRKVLAGPPPPVSSVAPETSPELVAILSRALQHREEDRYPDAAAMAADLAAYLDGRRVMAHRYTAADELRRLVRRWRLPLFAAAAGSLGLITAGAIGAGNAWQEQQRLTRVSADLEAALADADRRLGDGLTQRALLAFRAGDVGKAQLLASDALEHIEDADARGILADAAPHPRRVATVKVADCGAHAIAPRGLVCVDGRGLRLIEGDSGEQWISRLAGVGVVAQAWSDELLIIGEERIYIVDASAEGVALSEVPPTMLFEHAGPSGVPGFFASSGSEKARFFGLQDGARQTIDTMPCGDGEIERVGLIGVDDMLAWCRGGGILRGPPGAEELFLQLDGDHTPDSLALDAEGHRAAFGEITGDVWVLDLDTGQVLLRQSLGSGRVDQVVLSADGAWLAARVPGAGLEIIEVATGIQTHLPSQALDIGFHRDGRLRVWTPGALEVWQLPASEALAPVRLESSGVVSLSWGGDLIVATGESYARVDPQAPRDRVARGRVLDRVKSAAELMDRRILVGTLFGSFMDSGEGAVPLERKQVGRRVLPMRGGLVLVLGEPTWLWDSASDRSVMDESFMESVEGSVSPDGGVAAILGRDGTLRRLELGEPVTFEPLGSPPATAVAPGLNGWPVYLGQTDGVSVLTADGRFRPWTQTGARITDLAVSPDGSLVAGSDTEQRVWVWRASDGELLARLRGHSRRVSSLAFSPDGNWLATGSWDDTVRFWDTRRLIQPAAVVRREVEASWGMTSEDVGGR